MLSRRSNSGLLPLLLLLLPNAAQAQGPPAEPFLERAQAATRLLDVWPDARAGRAALRELGVEIAITYTGEAFYNTRGGASTDDAAEYLGLLDLALELNTHKLGLWPGGLLRIHGQVLRGRGVTARHVGAAQCLSNIEAPDDDEFVQLSTVTYRQELLDGKVWARLGKQDANDHFAASVHGLAFLHSSAGLPANLPAPSYPDPEWGAVGGVRLFDRLELRAAVFQGEPSGGRSLSHSFARIRGPFAIGQAGLSYELAGRAGLLQAGGWYSNDRFLDLDDPLGRSPHGNHGAYLIWDQWLWKESGEPEQGLAVFAQYSWARVDRSRGEHYVGAGAVWTGLLPRRDRDAVGLAAYYLRFSRYAGTARRDETAVELFYAAKLTGWLTLTPDLQLIVHPGGTDASTALVVGIRLTLEI